MALVGNSIGGSVALEVACLAPERVRCMVLSGSKAGHRPEPEFRDEALRVLSDDGLEAAWGRYWAPLFGPDAHDSVVAHGRAIAARRGATAVAAGVRAFHGRPDRAELLAAWAGPVWIVRGQHDLHPTRARQLADHLPNGRYREVERSGHYVPLEAPAAFTAIVAEALDDARQHEPPH
jgi:pimeloyl-ACP methyl ester carboxylesterase